VWPTAAALARRVVDDAARGGGGGPSVRGRRCAELGAGLGVVGLAAALVGAREVLRKTKPQIEARYLG